jgi:hypothetical protein
VLMFGLRILNFAFEPALGLMRGPIHIIGVASAVPSQAISREKLKIFHPCHLHVRMLVKLPRTVRDIASINLLSNHVSQSRHVGWKLQIDDA